VKKSKSSIGRLEIFIAFVLSFGSGIIAWDSLSTHSTQDVVLFFVIWLIVVFIGLFMANKLVTLVDWSANKQCINTRSSDSDSL
jgi:hypothetical protein